MSIVINSPSVAGWLGPTATFFAAVVSLFIALYADRARRKLFPPKLALRLENPKGVLVPGDGANAHTRWYHLRIQNLDRGSPASDVRVHLVKLEEVRNGNFVTLWEEPIPLTLRHEASLPIRRNVGRPLDTDFFFVAFDQTKLGPNPLLRFAVIRQPRNITVDFQGSTQLRATVFVDSVEVESPEFVFDIGWNGKWHEGNEEMALNLQVKSSAPTAS